MRELLRRVEVVCGASAVAVGGPRARAVLLIAARAEPRKMGSVSGSPRCRGRSSIPQGHGGVGEGVLPSLHPGTEYEVRVRAVNGHGAGAFSPGVKMVCLAGAPEVPSHHRHADATSRAVPPQVEGQQAPARVRAHGAHGGGRPDFGFVWWVAVQRRLIS